MVSGAATLLELLAAPAATRLVSTDLMARNRSRWRGPAQHSRHIGQFAKGKSFSPEIDLGLLA
jgi:hypothetical protein